MIPRFGGFQDRARSSQALVDAKQFATAMDALKAESEDDTYPEESDDVLEMAQLNDGTTVEEYSAANGSFRVKTEAGFSAGRTAGDSPVEIMDTPAAP
jgi:hypothetical protein